MTRFPITLAALLAATPVAAQTAPAPAPADPDDVVVTASRSGDAIEVRDVPASITVIGDDLLRDRQVRLVADVLRDVPGVAVNRSIGGLTDVRIRGTEANHVLVLIDGIEASDPFQGQFDFGTLLADEGAKVEVLRGQQSSLYGSDAIGGVIQYVTLTGAEAPGVRLRAEGGSFGTAAGAARVAGVADTLDYALTGTLYRTDGTPTARGGSRDIGATSAAGTAKLIWSPSATFSLTGVGRYAYTDSLSNDSESNPASPRFGYTVDSPGVHFRNAAWYGLARAALSLADGRWTNALTGQVADTTRTGYRRGSIDYGDRGQRLKGSFESTLRLGDEQVRHRLTAAVDYERERFRSRSPFSFQGNRQTTNWGIVGQYDLEIGDAFAGGASVRHDANDRFADATTWRAQAGYRLPFGLRVRGAYGTGVKNPGYYELFGYSDGRYIGNPNLKPERSEGWEAGLDQAIGARTTIGATYFDSRLKDEIYTTYPAPSFVATPANRTTRSTQRGVEAFVSARPIEQIRVDIAYTYLDAKENGREEVRRPDHIASFNATVFSTDKRFAGTLTVRYNGRMVDDAYIDPSYVPVRVPLQEYALVNLNAEYRLTSALTLFGRLDNLFDERYEEVFSFANPGRSAVGGVRARF